MNALEQTRRICNVTHANGQKKFGTNPDNKQYIHTHFKVSIVDILNCCAATWLFRTPSRCALPTMHPLVGVDAASMNTRFTHIAFGDTLVRIPLLLIRGRKRRANVMLCYC